MYVMTETNQQEHWNSIWQEKPPVGDLNQFAKNALDLIKERNLKTILDLGCGDGRDTLFFANNGMRVTACDFSEKALSKLKKQIYEKSTPNVECKVLDISKDLKSFSDNSFDAVYAHLTLHYFKNKETTQIFKELNRILKKEGLLFAKVKATDDALYGRGKEIEKDMFIHEGHIRHFFSKEYLQEKLKGFNVTKIRKTSEVYHSYKSNFIEAIATK